MEQFHLLDPYYEVKHRGRLTAEGAVLTLIFAFQLLLICVLMH